MKNRIGKCLKGCLPLWLLLTCLPMMGQTADSLFVENVLREAPANAAELYFARKFLDRPYVAHTLEVNDEEQLVVNTRQLDCTTLVENVVALTLCHKHKQTAFAQFKHYLQQLRYRQGKLNGYTSRLHYFSDWIDDNQKMGFVAEKQSEMPPFTATQTLQTNYMTQHSQAYKALKSHPELVKVIAKQERRLTGRKYRYIPKEQLANAKAMRQVVPGGSIIAIVTKKPGLDIAHLGFAVWRRDGLHLLNASQIHKKVIEEPMTFDRYMNEHPSFMGIRVVRVQ